MSDFQLSNGVLKQLSAPDADDSLLTAPHRFQVLAVKHISTTKGGVNDRYRLIFNDGQYYTQVVLATQLNKFVDSKELDKGVIIETERLTVNMVQGKRLIILLGFKVIGKSEAKIGEPVTIDIKAGLERTDSAMSDTTSTNASGSGANTKAQVSPAFTKQAPQLPVPVQPASGSKRSGVLPIEALSPYQNTWLIKARCTQKSDMKQWSNQRGEGKLFNVTLMDETGEIRATAFNAVADDLFPKFEEGKVYYVTKARVNLAKKKFGNSTNDYEISLEKNTEVEECVDASELPLIKYNFITLAQLQELPKDSICDVIAIVKDIAAPQDITTKSTGKNLTKRELTLVDKSHYTCQLTLWGKQAQDFNPDEQTPVIAFKSVKVSDFNGRSLSMVGSSLMTINPDVNEAFALRGWYDASGADESFTAHQRSDNTGSGNNASGGGFDREKIVSLKEVKDDIDLPEAGKFFSSRATIVHIKPETIAYPSCQNAEKRCQKKVIEDTSGKWRCESCDLGFDKPKWRYIMSMAVSDWSGQAWFQGFNDVGEAVFKMPADDLMSLKDNEPEKYNETLSKAAAQTFNFACRAKQDSFNDSTRIRYGITRIQQLDYKEEAQHLINKLMNRLSI